MDIAKLTDQQIKEDRQVKFMESIDVWTGYFRSNPHRFAEEFLGIKLKLFQKILLFMMEHSDAFYYVASRSQGKTYLVALYSCIRCILYPGTKICVASYSFKQGAEIIQKIQNEFMHQSTALCMEIKGQPSVSRDNCGVKFKNGSYMRVVIASESARGSRSNLLIIDESRLVDQKIVDTILRPMNGTPRQPGYLSVPEYSHLQESNKEFYMSSAYYAASEMFEKCKDYLANSLDPNLKYFICDLPYQLSIKEGLLIREDIERVMSEATFSDISFSMEYSGLFYGSAEDALFEFKILNDRRIIAESLRPLDYYRVTNTTTPSPVNGECRVLSVDIALLASKKHDNDASAIFIHSGIPTANNNYVDNIIYANSYEGLLAEELGLTIMRMYYQYKCQYIALDASGVGQPILDFLMSDRYDPVFGETYSALNVANRPELQDRCKSKDAPKVIYAIKANAQDNHDMCLSLRAGFQNGYINLLINENDMGVEDKITKVKGYTKLSEMEKAKLVMPYVHTTLLIDELINLEHDAAGKYIKVKERPGMRKDRYSSVMYGYYVLQELGRKRLKPKTTTEDLAEKLAKAMRPSSITGRTANMIRR